MKSILLIFILIISQVGANENQGEQFPLVGFLPDVEELNFVSYDYFPSEKKSETNKEGKDKKVINNSNNKVLEESPNKSAEINNQNNLNKKAQSKIQEIVMKKDDEEVEQKSSKNNIQKIYLGTKEELFGEEEPISQNLEEEILQTSIKEFDEAEKLKTKTVTLLESLNMEEKPKKIANITDLKIYNYDEIFIEINSRTNTMKVTAKIKNSLKELKTYRVSTGKENIQKPFGLGKISQISLNPTWYPTQDTLQSFAKRGINLPKVVPSGHKYNYMGAAKLNLTHIVNGQNTYRIHGTLNEKSIGTNESAGCIRMKNKEVIELAKFLEEFSELKSMSKISVNLI